MENTFKLKVIWFYIMDEKKKRGRRAKIPVVEENNVMIKIGKEVDGEKKFTGHYAPWAKKYAPKEIDDMKLPKEIKTKLNFVANNDIPFNMIIKGNCGSGKTTALKCIVRKKQDDDNIIIFTPADDRGIDVIKMKLLFFVRKETLRHKIVIFEDMDYNITDKTQNEISNIMKTYNLDVSYYFTCKDTKAIIDKIQSRCNIINFRELNENDTYDVLRNIYTECEDSGLKALYFISQGDIRSAITNMEIVSDCYNGEVNEENVYKVCYQPSPRHIYNIFYNCLRGQLQDAINSFGQLKQKGYCNSDIMQTIMKMLKVIDIEEDIRIEYNKIISNTYVRMTDGNDTNLQMYACLARLCSIRHHQ